MASRTPTATPKPAPPPEPVESTTLPAMKLRRPEEPDVPKETERNAKNVARRHPSNRAFYHPPPPRQRFHDSSVERFHDSTKLRMSVPPPLCDLCDLLWPFMPISLFAFPFSSHPPPPPP